MERIEESGALRTTLEQRFRTLRDAAVSKGLERGLEQWRLLLARQGGRKSASDAAVGRAGLLAGIRDPDRPQDVGEWIVDCGTGAESARTAAENRPAGPSEWRRILAEIFCCGLLDAVPRLEGAGVIDFVESDEGNHW